MNALRARVRLFVSLFLLLALAPVAFAQPSFQNNAQFKAIPTFESLGLYWNPPNKGTGQVAQVEYKPAGAPASQYKRGLDLWYDERTPAPSGGSPGEYRGSLVHLQPNTAYDIRLTLSPGGQQLEVPAQSACALDASCTKTWNENFPIGNTRVLTGAEVGAIDTPIIIGPADSGTASGYTLITATAEIDGNDLTASAPGRGWSGSCILVEHGTHHVIFRGLTLRNCRNSGINLRWNGSGGSGRTSDIVIEDSEFSGYATNDTDAGVHCNYNNQTPPGGEANRPERLIIQRNKFHSPRITSESWGNNGHPNGANMVQLNWCNGNHVIRYNELYSENGNFFYDGLGSVENFANTSEPWFGPRIKGAPYADSDIYGNVITHVFDDGLEVEGAGRNVRVWGNYFDKVFVPIANVNNAMGPLYVWRNVSHMLANMHTPGSPDTEGRGAFIKGGGRPTEWNGGRAYYFHNTILQPPSSACGASSTRCGAAWGFNSVQRDLYNFWSHNNLWQIHDTSSGADSSAVLAKCNLGNPQDQTECRLSHDMYNGGAIQGATVTMPPDWRNEIPTYVTSGQQYPATASIPSAANGWTGDFRLQSGSTGQGAALALFNFSDQFGSAPDVGAHQSGCPPMRFGRNGTSGCAGTPPPPPPTAVLATTPSPATGPAPLGVVFDASGSSGGAGSIASLRLQFGHNGQEVTWTDKSVTQSYSYPVGSYTATLTVTDNSVPPRTATTTTEVNATQQCSGTVPTARLAASPTSGSAPLTVNFDGSASTAVSPATIVSYSINYGDNTGTGTGVTQTHQYAGNGTFNARLTVTDSNGCQSPSDPQNDTRTITVGPGGESVTLQEGLNSYAGTTDTSGNSDQPGAGYGSHAEISIGYDNDRFMNLVRFKIFASEGGPVPDGATITSATLSLHKTAGQDAVVEAKRLLRNWHETQASWTNAATGAPWQVAGARGAADVAASGDGTAPIPVGNGWFNVDVTESVQAFAAGAASNFGWRINHVSGPNSIKDYASRNYGTQSLRPKLTITFSGGGGGSQATETMREGLNGYVGTSDTSGNQDQPGAGYGSHAEISIGYDNSRFMNLIRFKIFAAEGGRVPSGASIVSATLSLHKTGGQEGVVEAKRLLRDWHETQASWTNAATGTPWQVAGALGSADVAATGDGSATIPAANGWFNVDVTESVQAFAAGTATNYGWRVNHVSGPNSIKDYASRNHGTANQRPTLTVIYTTD
jgi:PKD repeat protein